MLSFSNHFVQKYFSAQLQEVISKITDLGAEIIDKNMQHNENIVSELSKSPILSNDIYSIEDRVKFYEERAKKLDFTCFFDGDLKDNAKILLSNSDTLQISDEEFFKKSSFSELFTSKITAIK